MQFPESWLREFCNPPLSTAELAETLTMAGLEVEELEAVPDGLSTRLRRRYYDTTHVGNSAAGHTFPDVLNDQEKTAVIEYLKTL